MFRSVLRPSSGVSHRALSFSENEKLGKPIHPNISPTRPTYHRTTNKRTQPTVWTRTTTTEQRRQYTSRHHTDRYIASIHVQVSHTSFLYNSQHPISPRFVNYNIDIYILQTTYRHRLECDEAGMLTRGNCAGYGDWPLMMVGGLTETCWVF